MDDKTTISIVAMICLTIVMLAVILVLHIDSAILGSFTGIMGTIIGYAYGKKQATD